jgi:hypothetical protein
MLSNKAILFWSTDMNKVLRMAFALILSYVVAGIATAQPSTATPATERAIFGDAESFKNSVHLSDKVLDVLLATNEAEYARQLSLEKPDEDRNKYFSAVEVHLSGTYEVDYVVEGNLPLAGADNAWFWVVRSARTHPKVVLFASGGFLELLKSRTNGYRNIRSVWQSPNERITRVYHFNGERYILVHKYDKLLGSEE